jgi:hypothetical protein
MKNKKLYASIVGALLVLLGALKVILDEPEADVPSSAQGAAGSAGAAGAGGFGGADAGL